MTPKKGMTTNFFSPMSFIAVFGSGGTDFFLLGGRIFGPFLAEIFLVRVGDTWLQEMIDEADRDGDGEVNEDDFLRIMKKTGLY
jgi:hypothetical protein